MAQAISIEDQEPAGAWKPFLESVTFGLALYCLFAAPFIIPHLPDPLSGWLGKTPSFAPDCLIGYFLFKFGCRAWQDWRSAGSRRNEEVGRAGAIYWVFGFVFMAWFILGARPSIIEDHRKLLEAAKEPKSAELLPILPHP